jgi:hypothetical protein
MHHVQRPPTLNINHTLCVTELLNPSKLNIVQSFLHTQIATFHALTELKCLKFSQSLTFDVILSQINPIHTPRFSYIGINIILSNTPTSSFFSRYLKKIFYTTLHYCNSRFRYTPVLLFYCFDTISENCYCSQAVYTERVRNPFAGEQEEWWTVLKVGSPINRTLHVACVTQIT